MIFDKLSGNGESNTHPVIFRGKIGLNNTVQVVSFNLGTIIRYLNLDLI